MAGRRSKEGARDVVFTLSGDEKSFRLVTDARSGSKLWRVTEPDSERRRSSDATYIAKDWSRGTGLNRFTPGEGMGDVLRIADGYGIDLTNGQIEHGPGSASVGAITGTMVKFILFNDLVWILTTTHLYHYNGTTLTDFWGPAASGATHETNPSTTLADIELFNNKLYICDGTDIYRTDGTTDPNLTKSTDNADFLLALQTATGPQLWRAYDTNLIASTTNPDAASPTWSTAITVGPGEDITSMHTLSGLLFVNTESTIFSISSAGEALELDKRLQTQRSSKAFSVVSNSGSDVWLSDQTPDILQMVAIDFEQFDIRKTGPFQTSDAIPFTELESRGDVKSITQDTENVYVTVERGSDVYVYKGAEKQRGLFIWSPLIRVASTTNVASGVFQLSTESNPFFYMNTGSSIVKYQVRDWTLFNDEWQVEFPFFDNADELELKVWTRLLVFAENSGTSGDFTVTPARKLDNATSYTNLPFTFANDGVNTVVSGILPGRRIRLRLTCASTDTTKSYTVRSVKLEGIRKPELKKLYDMTVFAESKGDLDFLESLRNASSAFLLFKDRQGTQRQGVVLPGFPEETEVRDENKRGIHRRYRLVIQEVLSS